MPRFPLIFGITLAWCCGRAPEATITHQGDGTGGGKASTSSGGSRAAAGFGSESGAGAGAAPEQSGGAGGAPEAGASGSGPTSGGAGEIAGSGSGPMSGGSGEVATGGSTTTGGDTGASAGTGGPPVTSTLCTLAGEDPNPAASRLGSLYRSALGNDCHYAGLICGVDPLQKVALANDLIQLGLGLWHCPGKSATRFHLVYPGRKVTALEAEGLIDLYVTLTLESLPFTSEDGAKIRDELRLLAIASIDESASSLSLCNASVTWTGCAGVVGPGVGGAGGAAGAAGAGNADSGAAGSAGAGASGLGGAGNGG